MNKSEEIEEGSGTGTHAGTKERIAYRALLRDTIALLGEEKRKTLPIQLPPLPKTSFVPASVPVPGFSSSPSRTPQPSPKTSFVPVPARVPDPSFSFSPSSDSKAVQSTALQGARSAHSSFNLASHFPDLAHLPTPPDDSRAQENAARWKKAQVTASVVILSFGEKDDQLLYLKNLAKAIHTRLKPTKILDGQLLEKEKRWETLFRVNTFDLLLVTEAGLAKTDILKKLVEEPSFSAKTPLLLLTPTVMQEKAALWKKICLIVKK